MILPPDFRQTFPIIPKVLKTTIVDVSIKSWELFKKSTVFTLNENMRGRNSGSDCEFDKWLLDIDKRERTNENKKEALASLIFDDFMAIWLFVWELLISQTKFSLIFKSNIQLGID